MRDKGSAGEARRLAPRASKPKQAAQPSDAAQHAMQPGKVEFASVLLHARTPVPARARVPAAGRTGACSAPHSHARNAHPPLRQFQWVSGAKPVPAGGAWAVAQSEELEVSGQPAGPLTVRGLAIGHPCAAHAATCMRAATCVRAYVRSVCPGVFWGAATFLPRPPPVRSRLPTAPIYVLCHNHTHSETNMYPPNARSCSCAPSTAPAARPSTPRLQRSPPSCPAERC